MPQVVKPNTYTLGSLISPTEVNANEDAIINALNALDEDNFDPSTQIPNSMLAEIQPDIVDAHADDAAEYLTATTPGTTASPSIPAQLTGEIERLRYRLLANNNLVSTAYMDSSAVQQEAGWVEPPIVGPQLFANNGFETKTSAVAGDAPDGWTLEGTPTSLVITAPGLAVPLAGVNKKALRVTFRTTPNEGFKQTLSGLKASTKYLIGMTFAKVSGSPVLKITTTGGLGSGAYQNLAATTATVATISHFQAIVQTTTAGDPIVVKFTNTASAADVVDFYQVWAYEIKDSTNLGLPHIPMQTATSTTAVTYPTSGWTGTGATWRTQTITGLSLSQYVPCLGYRFVYDVTVPFKDIDATAGRAGSRLYGAIRLQIDAGATNTVSGPVYYETIGAGSDIDTGGTLRLRYAIENPTPGSTYNFSFLLGVYDDSTFEQVSIPPLVATVQMESRATLTAERL